MQRQFFSIVVPAHNEESGIGETLARLAAQDYPKDRYEVLVVENGSTDGTLAAAKKYEGVNIRVLTFKERGVSFARNRGSEAANPDGDWVLYLDADTYLAPAFLGSLDTFITDRGYRDRVAAVFRVLPRSKNLLTRFLFPWANFWRALSHSVPYTTFLVRRDIVKKIRSDEERQVAEDIAFVSDAQQYGKSFYMGTSCITTSTRRFESEGWIRMITLWVSIMPLPAYLQRRFQYKVIR